MTGYISKEKLAVVVQGMVWKISHGGIASNPDWELRKEAYKMRMWEESSWRAMVPWESGPSIKR
jgi:hypothetical protein